MVLALVIQINR